MALTQTTSTYDNSTLFGTISNDIIDKGYSIRPNALPQNLIDLLVFQIGKMSSDDFKQAGIGRANEHTINQFVRSDAICWITGESEAGKAWLDWTSSLQRFLNRELFLGLFSFESHFAHYAKGDFYKKHKDAFTGEGNRILSVVVYLNQNWSTDDGGELVIYNGDKPTSPIIKNNIVKVTPTLGTVVVFLSEDFPHEVLPAQRDRYSIAGWFRLNNSIGNNIDPPK